MRVIKKPVKYKSLSIPEPLFKEMYEYVQNNSKYRTMAEFLREAIRDKLYRPKGFSSSPNHFKAENDRRDNHYFDKRLKKYEKEQEAIKKRLEKIENKENKPEKKKAVKTNG